MQSLYFLSGDVCHVTKEAETFFNSVDKIFSKLKTSSTSDQPVSQPTLATPWRNYFTARCQNYQIFLDQISRKILDKFEIFGCDGDGDV